jgi:hypothetical protein
MRLDRLSKDKIEAARRGEKGEKKMLTNLGCNASVCEIYVQ